MKKKVLVYPCGTEIGLEIYRGVKASIHFELIGGSSSYDHGRFVYPNHIDHLPFITDDSTLDEVIRFNEMIASYGIDFIYPAMDGVIYKFGQYREALTPTLIAPDTTTITIARSKKRTYETLKGHMEIPELFEEADRIKEYPVFMKPDVGQGSRNSKLVNSRRELEYELSGNKEKMLILEYLPGEEYTVDCFTNEEGQVIYAGGRSRKRVKNGISVNAVEVKDSEFLRIAKLINSVIPQKGGWFFQLKKNSKGNYSLLEIATRIAGTSSFTRNLGVNLPLLTLHLFNGNKIDRIIANDYNLELDRALYNKFKTDISYDHVYVDYDDTLVADGRVNLQLISFLYQCRNEGIPITLISKHAGDLEEELKSKRVKDVFDEIIHLDLKEEKYQYIKSRKPIFIDDSYGERAKVQQMLQIPVFDAHMVECLLQEIG